MNFIKEKNMAYAISLLLYTLGILNLVEGFYMIKNCPKFKKQYMLYTLATFCSFLWSFSFAMLWIQTDPAKARMWRAIGMVGTLWVFFVMNELFIHWLKGNRGFKIYVRIISGIGVLLWPFLIGEKSVTYYLTPVGMTYQFTQNIWNMIYNVVCVLIAINYFVIFILIKRQATRKKLKVIINQLIVCVCVVVIGMVFDTILPVFGYDAFPASTLAQGIGVLMISRVMKFQQTSEITVDNISSYVYYSVDTPILIYDENGRFHIANAGATEFLGCSSEQFKSMEFGELFAIPKDCMNFLENKMELEAECNVNKRYCQLKISKIFDEYDESIGYIVVVNDLTEKRDFITKLQESEQAAEMANRAKSNFLARMSHEIRTPINGVIGMNKMILQKCKDEQIVGYAKMVQISARNLVELVNDILDISKIEANHMQIENSVYQFIDVLHEVVDLMRVRAQEKGLGFHVDIVGNIPNALNGDGKKLRQILMNVISNAVKYTQKGSISVIVEGLWKESDYYLNFIIKDTGIGIKKENIDKIFEAFERVDTANNKGIEGTGLGLAIVKNLVRMMDGSIHVNSEYGVGSEFIIEIPQKPVSEEKFNADTFENGDVEDIKEYQVQLCIPDKSILVVDDNEINRIVASELLSYTKAIVDTAASGKECFELVRKKKYDFILLDHIMPEIDGIEVLEELKKMSDNKSNDAVIIVLTANAIQGSREDYLKKGFDDYLSKPIEMEQVEKVLSKYL